MTVTVTEETYQPFAPSAAGCWKDTVGGVLSSLNVLVVLAVLPALSWALHLDRIDTVSRDRKGGRPSAAVQGDTLAGQARGGIRGICRDGHGRGIPAVRTVGRGRGEGCIRYRRGVVDGDDLGGIGYVAGIVRDPAMHGVNSIGGESQTGYPGAAIQRDDLNSRSRTWRPSR